MSKVTEAELNDTMKLSHVLVSLATTQSIPVGLTALIMATAVAAKASGAPLENISALIDKSIADVYATADNIGFGEPLN